MEGKDDATPFVKYILQMVIAAYRDFEDRINIVDGKKPVAEQVRAAAGMKIGKFTKSEIMEIWPGLSRASAEKSLTALVNEGMIV